MKINLQKLDERIESNNEVNDDDLLVMELLNFCHTPQKLTQEKLNSFKSRHFIAAKRILNFGENNDILLNMSGYEFIQENLNDVEPQEEEDDEFF